jgi:uncharacterized membrane protein
MTNGIQIERLQVAEEDGLFWAMDWISTLGGHATLNRYHLSFKNKRDAESFVKAAKRAVKS